MIPVAIISRPSLTLQGHFACAKCSDPIINDDTQTSAAQWAAADGDNAWENAKGWWTVLRNGGDDSIGAIQGFVECISWYWQGPTQWDCGDLGETFCDSVVTCDKANIPAAGLTMTAWANIHMVSAHGGYMTTCSNFSSSTTICILALTMQVVQCSLRFQV